MKTLSLAILASVVIAGCGPDYQSSDQIQNQHQEQMNKQAVQSVGMPAITRWSEKRMLKNILELRDEQISTTTYFFNEMTGKIGDKVCDSLGYGIPYATQYTNPQQPSGYSSYAIAQADPNGLYSPASAEGTWVLCLNPKDHRVSPLYVEPRIIVSPYPLK